MAHAREEVAVAFPIDGGAEGGGQDITHGVSVVLIDGQSGWIVVDPLTSVETAAAAVALARKHLGNQPIRAVIFTHSHADHFGGAKGVLPDGAGDVPPFGSRTASLTSYRGMSALVLTMRSFVLPLLTSENAAQTPGSRFPGKHVKSGSSPTARLIFMLALALAAPLAGLHQHHREHDGYDPARLPQRQTLAQRIDGIALDRGRYTHARELLEESLKLNRALGDRQHTALSLNNLGVVAQMASRVVVPMIGSPPIPMAVVIPKPAFAI